MVNGLTYYGLQMALNISCSDVIEQTIFGLKINFWFILEEVQNLKRQTVSEFVCVEVLRAVNPMGSCRARSVYLTIRLLGRLSPLSG